jgi:hypothetical protein
MAIWISSQSDIAFDDRTRLQIITDKEVHNFDAFVNNRQKTTKKLAKEAKLAQKESNKCKVTAEEDLLLSIE